MPISPNTRLAATKQAFHDIVQKLYFKTQEPTGPKNYRGGIFVRSEKYMLLHEEEQHLADHIAVLTQVREGPSNVSAVMIEERSDRARPSSTVRIASNKTPSAETVSRLRECLDTVEEIARAETDADADDHKSKLLSQIIKISEKRLQARMNTQKNKHGKLRLSLCDRVEKLRCMLLEQEINADISHWRGSLCNHLSNLTRNIRMAGLVSKNSQIEHLAEVILAAHNVSTTANTPSLECQLHTRDIKIDLSNYSTVLQIDKISRYLDIRNDLMKFCRKRRCRHLFRNIQLEVCTAPQDQRVHGEIQLIFFYEQHPANPPPRCIGSSKSACFLCDLFIRKHGAYHISHSHARLYPKWTIPVGKWMDEEKVLRFDGILREMGEEMMQIEKGFVRRPGYVGNGAESRVHLLALPESAKLSRISLAKICEIEPYSSNLDRIEPRGIEIDEHGMRVPDISGVTSHTNTKSPSIIHLKVEEPDGNAILPFTKRSLNDLNNNEKEVPIKSFTMSPLKTHKSELYPSLNKTTATEFEIQEIVSKDQPFNRSQNNLANKVSELIIKPSKMSIPKPIQSSLHLPSTIYNKPKSKTQWKTKPQNPQQKSQQSQSPQPLFPNPTPSNPRHQSHLHINQHQSS